MFNRIKTILGKKQKEKSSRTDDVMEVPRLLEALINRAALQIVENCKDKLMTEPATYIVPAVWGAIEKGEIDKNQKEIYNTIAPVVREINNSLQTENLSTSQKFTLEYLIKGLIISKVNFMMEVLKNRMNNNPDVGNRSGSQSLEHLEPLGNA